jgi:hypothetical protein
MSLNVMCVNANRTELAPIIYETWPNARRMNETMEWLDFWPYKAFGGNVSVDANNHTVLDKIFNWRDRNGVITGDNVYSPDRGRPSNQRFDSTQILH